MSWTPDLPEDNAEPTYPVVVYDIVAIACTAMFSVGAAYGLGLNLLWLGESIVRRYIITADAIEKRSIFGARRLQRTEVAGYVLMFGGRFGSRRYLRSIGGGASMSIPENLVPRTSWVGRLPRNG